MNIISLYTNVQHYIQRISLRSNDQNIFSLSTSNVIISFTLIAFIISLYVITKNFRIYEETDNTKRIIIQNEIQTTYYFVIHLSSIYVHSLYKR